jgi:hypothetical protein
MNDKPTMNFGGKVTKFSKNEDGSYLAYAFAGRHLETDIQFAILASTKQEVVTLCRMFLINEFPPDLEKINLCIISKPPATAAKDI